MAAWLPCRARTCGYCREVKDEDDLARFAYSLRDYPDLYLSEIPTKHWERTRKRATRHGFKAFKMATPAGHDRIEVVSTMPLTAKSRPASMGDVKEALDRRPTWAPGRAKTSGVGLVSVPKWEQIVSEREQRAHSEAEAETMSPLVTIELLTIAAAALKIPYRIESAGTVRLATRWEDSRMVALRAWSKDPDGMLSWDRMLHEAKTAQDARPPLEAEVPMEVYERQLAFSGVA